MTAAPAAASKAGAGQTSEYATVAASGSRRGRPRKFNQPSLAVTLTLPEDVIATLTMIDTDLSRAVVRAVQPLASETARPPAELTTYGIFAVISVPPNRALKERTGVELVPLCDGRALISFEDRLSVPQIELRLRDALADPTLDDDSRAVFEAVAEILKTARQDAGLEVCERSIIVLHRTKSVAEDATRRRSDRRKPQG
jgi:hypothetical protein